MEHPAIHTCCVTAIFIVLVIFLWTVNQGNGRNTSIRREDFDTHSFSNFSNVDDSKSAHEEPWRGPRVSKRDLVVNLRANLPCCRQLKAYFKDVFGKHLPESVSKLCQQACKTPAVSGHSVDTDKTVSAGLQNARCVRTQCRYRQNCVSRLAKRPLFQDTVSIQTKLCQQACKTPAVSGHSVDTDDGAREASGTWDREKNCSVNSGWDLFHNFVTEDRCYSMGPVDDQGRFYRDDLDLSSLLEDSKVSQTQRRGTSLSSEESEQYFVDRRVDPENMTQEEKNSSERITARKRSRSPACDCPCECRVSDRARGAVFRDRKCRLFSSTSSPCRIPEPCGRVKDCRPSLPTRPFPSTASSRSWRWGHVSWTRRACSWWYLKRMVLKERLVNKKTCRQFGPVPESVYAKGRWRTKTLSMMLGNQEFRTDEEGGEGHHQRCLVFLSFMLVLMEDQSAWEMARRLRDRLLSLISHPLVPDATVTSADALFKKLSRLCGFRVIESASTLNTNISKPKNESCDSDVATKPDQLCWSRFAGALIPQRQTQIWVAPVVRVSLQLNSTDAADLDSFGHRLASMAALPPSCRLDRVQLARAGFHYNSGVRADAVVCHRCRASYRLDNCSTPNGSRAPLSVHQAASPRCPLLGPGECPSLPPPASSPGVIRRSSSVENDTGNADLNPLAPQYQEEGTPLIDPAEIGVHVRGQGADDVHGPALVNPASIGVTLSGPPTAVQASPPLLIGTPAAMGVTMRASSVQPFGQPQALLGEAPSPEAPPPVPIPLLPPPSPRQMDMNSMQSSGPTSSMVQQLPDNVQVPGRLSPMPQQLPDANRRSGELGPVVQQLPDNVQVPGHLSLMPQGLSDNMRSSRPSDPRPDPAGERPSQASRSASVTSEQPRGRGWWGFRPTNAGYVDHGLRLESFRDRAWRVVDIRQLSHAGFFSVDTRVAACFCCDFRLVRPDEMLTPSARAVWLHAIMLQHHQHCPYAQTLGPGQPTSTSTHSPAQPSNSSSTATTVVEEAERGKCRTCRAREATVVFLPCGHLLSCQPCAQTQHHCPLCRSTVQGTVATFFS